MAVLVVPMLIGGNCLYWCQGLAVGFTVKVSIGARGAERSHGDTTHVYCIMYKQYMRRCERFMGVNSVLYIFHVIWCHYC